MFCHENKYCFYYFLRCFFSYSSAQTITDTLTLTGGYIRSSANGGGRLQFANHTLGAMTNTNDSCMVGSKREPLWDLNGTNCPPCALYSKFLNKKFLVTYQIDSVNDFIDTRTNALIYDTFMKINKMVLLPNY